VVVCAVNPVDPSSHPSSVNLLLQCTQCVVKRLHATNNEGNQCDGSKKEDNMIIRWNIVLPTSQSAAHHFMNNINYNTKHKGYQFCSSVKSFESLALPTACQ